MLGFEILQVLSFLVAVALLTPLIGTFWSLLVQGKPTFLHPAMEWLEKGSYQAAGVNPAEQMNWIQYAKNLVVFNLLGGLLLFLILVLQDHLPLNPQNLPGVPWKLALNIAVSYITSTNWQSYSGEETLSYASQMLGLTVQNFLSAGTGSAVLMALIRGLINKSNDKIGNFWCDLVRTVVYLLLPLSFLLACVFLTQGVIQTFLSYQIVDTLEKGQQVIPLGPVASQEAIKIIGVNGGGFFNANSAHPFENPTPLTNFLQNVFLIAIPAGMAYAYGLLLGSKRHAYLIFGVMTAIWLSGFAVAVYSETRINPVLEASPLWEGKEVRIGNLNSVLWATVTTVTSNGSVNAMHESLSPLAGGAALLNMMFGEVVFGGIGVGLCGMVMYLLLTVFVCGLMVGRTPEYQGKKLGIQDIQWIVVSVLTPNILILLGAGVASALPEALSSLSTRGPHGLTELLYAFTSAAVNNGSAFSGLDANTDFFNVVLAIIMLIARAAVVIPSLAIAGRFAVKSISPASAGTLSTNSLLFAGLLFSVILIVGGLSFLPALFLGPIVEHLLMIRGQSFPLGGA